MDNAQIWLSIQEIQKHTSIMNNELGKTMTDVAWLKASWWEMMNWIRVIGCGIIIVMGTSIWNILILKKNGKK